VFIQELINDYSPDILFLQETWLLQTETHILNVFNDYNVFSISGVDQNSRILSGRKYGGVACLVKRSPLLQSAVQYNCHNNRMCSLIIPMSNGRKLQIVNVYLPCDNYKDYTVDDTFAACTNDIEQLYLDVKPDLFILGGDLNVDFSRRNAHSNYLCQMLNRLGLNIGWRSDNAITDNTFIGPTGSSCIDHIIMSKNIYDKLTRLHVIDHDLNPP